MALTPAQKTTLKNFILTDPVLAPLAAAGDYDAIANNLNSSASPNFTVWKTLVTITQVGDKINGTELAGLTANNLSRLQTVAGYSAGGINPSLADRRQFFDDIFSGAGGQVTRPALLALWKRLANRTEKLFATGTGSDAAPATMTFEGTVDVFEIGGILA